MGDSSNNLMGGASGMGGAGSGISTGSGMGTFKSANSLGHLPSGGATPRGTGGLTMRAIGLSTKHSTKGLSGPKPFTAKIRPVKNVMKDIGRKRGY